MTTVTAAANWALRMDQLDLPQLYDGTISIHDATQIRVSYGPTSYTDFLGHFTYDGSGDLVGGTLNSINEIIDGVGLSSVSDFSVAARTFVRWVETDNVRAAYKVLLQGGDHLSGGGLVVHAQDFYVV
jgi:hypothetical protein